MVLALLLAAIMLLLAATPALAGDKVRGEKGQGEVKQNQVMDPPPFQ